MRVECRRLAEEEGRPAELAAAVMARIDGVHAAHD
jgi:hypothetical protein